MSSEAFQDKIVTLKKSFDPSLFGAEELYKKLIEMGKALPPYPLLFKTKEHLVRGCQSDLYLNASLKEGKLFFDALSESLISAGLAAFLISVYNGEPPETLLQHSPTFLEELGISTSLSPGRSNGLSSIHLRMKQEALKQFLFINQRK